MRATIHDEWRVVSARRARYSREEQDRPKREKDHPQELGREQGPDLFDPTEVAKHAVEDAEDRGPERECGRGEDEHLPTAL
jgi:hypothetical protein